MMNLVLCNQKGAGFNSFDSWFGKESVWVCCNRIAYGFVLTAHHMRIYISMDSFSGGNLLSP
ncbi:unnamed protein product [Coffea canephora]|uniref:Uncharacterized protein n=1 Tax=Coffea canephora TaxID=49390 RepID=A0A068UT42_COFCA|nr:unnamed protein product [Coffea canephora]